MKESDVVLTPVPQADGSIKNRPAILLREIPPYKDFLVCGVSSQLRQQVKGFDEIISPSDSDFSSSGLETESLIRLGFLAVIPLRHHRFNRFDFIRTAQTAADDFESVLD
jgi:mRNA interferase MazF